MLSKPIWHLMVVLFIPTLFAQGTGKSAFTHDQKTPINKTLSPPPVMRVCANPDNWSKCSTWTWSAGHYDGWREWGAIATMTVRSFTRDSVIIDRSDIGEPGPGRPGTGFKMTYRGTISSDGNSVLDGVSIANNGTSGRFRAYWGAAINDNSGLNSKITLTDIPCNAATFKGSAEEAAARASQALELRKNEAAVCWLRIGAKKGNPDAQGMLAAMLYKGLGGPPSYSTALPLAQKAAAQDNYLGDQVLSLMYANGQGVQKDAWQAQFWGTKAEKDKSAAIAERQRKQQSQAAQAQSLQQRSRQNLVGMIILGLMFASMDGDSGTSGNSDPLDRYNALKYSCSEGFTSSCNSIGEKPPSDQQ